MKTYVTLFLAISISIVSMAKGSYSWPMMSADSISDDDSYNAGCTFYAQGDTVRAAECFRKSVQQGNTKDAAFQLGLIYLDRANVSESDLELATYYFKMSAVAGKAEAFSYVGDLMRLSGADEQALLFYLEGAQSGNKDAMYSLAELYFEREEYASAAYWANKCPDNVLALYLLGWTYYMLQDFDHAKYYWQQCVFRFHYADAVTMLKSLDSGGCELLGTCNGLAEL